MWHKQGSNSQKNKRRIEIYLDFEYNDTRLTNWLNTYGTTTKEVVSEVDYEALWLVVTTGVGDLATFEDGVSFL